MIPKYKKYKSKISLGLLGFISLFFGVGLYYMTIDWNSIGAIIHLVTFTFVYYLFFSISYEIKGEYLLINYAAFYKKKIEISSINQIKETQSLISAPAASLDRMEIFFNRFDSVIISPKNKKEFIEHIKYVNPEIQIKLKKST
ncbi:MULTISPECIES: PH domain-containing protein [Flavobacteriaceae]|uniref:PH domain-containing protein n=1 Tax=Flavobacteriaceae TaxID=49546 RepID=UPI001492B07C|nr:MULTISPECIES: PH domain-containing protein [Allomuricauda]MDC6367486.1 PH domain-containing protein [Muricauda sp. AC10]